MSKRANKLLVLIGLSSLLLQGFYDPVESKSDVNLGKKLDVLIDNAIAQNLIVGLVLIVKHDQKILYKRAAGFLDKEKSIKMPENAIFRYSSMSKPITIATALSLADRGIIDMSEPVSKYLPYFTPTTDLKPVAITLEQLASHTSGLDYPFIEAPDGPYHKANITDGLMEDPFSYDENLRRLSTIPLLFEPGKGFRYSISIDVLGKVIEAATKQPLEKSISTSIAKPLKMKDLTFTVKKKQLNRLTLPYCNTTGGAKLMGKNQFVAFGGSGFVFSPSRATDKTAFQSGGSGLCGTASEYMHFIDYLQTQQVMSKIRSGGYPVSFGKGWEFGYCGAILTDPKLARSCQNKGTMAWGGAYGHTWFCDPEAKISVVCMTNTTPYALQGAFPDSIRDVVYNFLTKKFDKKIQLKARNTNE